MVESTVDLEQRKQGRKIILTIVAIPIAIILMSSVLYYLANNKMIDLGTVNNGELVSPPVQFSEMAMQTLNGGIVDYTKPEPKWSFVVIGGKNCLGTCEKMLYLARQTNIALAKRMSQVKRYYVTSDGEISPELSERLKSNYSNVSVVKATKNTINTLFKETGLNPFQENRFYVVDQRGWLMMHYTADNLEQDSLNELGKKIIKDMKRLLK